MAKRKIYRVTPVTRQGDRYWRLKGPGVNTIWGRKSDQVRAGRNVAKAQLKKGNLAQLVIHKADGKIQTEHTYGKDPKRTKG